MMKNVPCVILILVLAVAEFVQMEDNELYTGSIHGTDIETITTDTKKIKISTQVLDTSLGILAHNVSIKLYKLQEDTLSKEWRIINEVTSDIYGHCPELIDSNDFEPGYYKLSFDMLNYFKEMHKRFLYRFVEIFFECESKDHYYIPLLLNPFGYSTYRGFEQKPQVANESNTKGRTISTYVLDTTLGKGVDNIEIGLQKLDVTTMNWNLLSHAKTNNEGVSPILVSSDSFELGDYKLFYNTKSYFNRTNTKTPYPRVEINFKCTTNLTYFIPLLLNPFGYSTHRVFHQSIINLFNPPSMNFKIGGTISTRIFDTSLGKGADNVTIILYKFEANIEEWDKIGEYKTKNDGRSRELVSKIYFETGYYKLYFNTTEYFKRSNTKSLYSSVEIAFLCSYKMHYHVSLVLNPFGYSTNAQFMNVA